MAIKLEATELRYKFFDNGELFDILAYDLKPDNANKFKTPIIILAIKCLDKMASKMHPGMIPVKSIAHLACDDSYNWNVISEVTI